MAVVNNTMPSYYAPCASSEAPPLPPRERHYAAHAISGILLLVSLLFVLGAPRGFSLWGGGHLVLVHRTYKPILFSHPTPSTRLRQMLRHGIQEALWLDDGSTTIRGDGRMVTCSAQAKGDAVFHALWRGDGPVSAGAHYWEVENKGGLHSVGMTTLDFFAKGYASRMFSCNAINLSDGAALLVARYGPGRLGKGDKLGVLVEMSPSALTITFFSNGHCLGPAFHIAAPYPTELYPVVTFKDGGASAGIHKNATLPHARQREVAGKPFPEGEWKAEGAPATLSIQKAGEGVYAAGLHVVNQCNMQLIHKDGGWSASPAMMTLMAGAPDLMLLEQQFLTKLQALTRLEDQGGRLLVSGPAGDLTFWPVVPGLLIPYTSNPLVRNRKELK